VRYDFDPEGHVSKRKLRYEGVVDQVDGNLRYKTDKHIDKEGDPPHRKGELCGLIRICTSEKEAQWIDLEKPEHYTCVKIAPEDIKSEWLLDYHQKHAQKRAGRARRQPFDPSEIDFERASQPAALAACAARKKCAQRGLRLFTGGGGGWANGLRMRN